MDVFILGEDANTTADGHSCAFVVTWGRTEKKNFIFSVKSCLARLDFLCNEIKILSIRRLLTSDHDDTDASSPAQLDGAHDFLTRRVEHANAAHKGQVSLEKKRKQ